MFRADKRLIVAGHTAANAEEDRDKDVPVDTVLNVIVANSGMLLDSPLAAVVDVVVFVVEVKADVRFTLSLAFLLGQAVRNSSDVASTYTILVRI